MKWVANISHPKPLSFEIEKQTLHAIMDHPDSVEYTLYVYENDNEIYHDHQDTLEIAQSVALKKFNVPLEAWKQVE